MEQGSMKDLAKVYDHLSDLTSTLSHSVPNSRVIQRALS